MYLPQVNQLTPALSSLTCQHLAGHLQQQETKASFQRHRTGPGDLIKPWVKLKYTITHASNKIRTRVHEWTSAVTGNQLARGS